MDFILSLPTTAFAYIMRFLYSFLGNYGLCLIVFTIIIKLLLLPLGVKQQKNLMKQAILTPKMNKIKEKYANDPQKQNEEMQRLQAESGFSPMAGCLPLLIQLPIIMSLYSVIRQPLTWVFGMHLENSNDLAYLFNMVEEVSDKTEVIAQNMQIEILSKLNGPIELIPQAVQDWLMKYYNTTPADYAFDNTILGIDLSGTPSLAEPSLLWLIPLFALAGALLQSFISQKFTLKASKTRSSSIMAYSTCIISLIFAFTLPAAIGFYWGLSSFLGCIQTYFLGKKYDPNKYLEELEEQKRSEKEQAKIDKKLRRLERLKEIQAEQEAIKAKYRKK
ncbi:MAG: YidC/Oxa1 family membrane protein insertase [Clostridia bacterium]|nr:YidC/Oxa1 family membrane protein insertase [Clostridia bacterium]